MKWESLWEALLLEEDFLSTPLRLLLDKRMLFKTNRKRCKPMSNPAAALTKEFPK